MERWLLLAAVAILLAVWTAEYLGSLNIDDTDKVTSFENARKSVVECKRAEYESSKHAASRYLEAGSPIFARPCLRDATLEHPYNSELLSMLAQIEKQLGDPRSALAAKLKLHALLKPTRQIKYVQHLLELSEYYIDTLDEDKAAEILGRALELAPNQAVYHSVYSRLVEVQATYNPKEASKTILDHNWTYSSGDDLLEIMSSPTVESTNFNEVELSSIFLANQKPRQLKANAKGNLRFKGRTVSSPRLVVSHGIRFLYYVTEDQNGTRRIEVSVSDARENWRVWRVLGKLPFNLELSLPLVGLLDVTVVGGKFRAVTIHSVTRSPTKESNKNTYTMWVSSDGWSDWEAESTSNLPFPPTDQFQSDNPSSIAQCGQTQEMSFINDKQKYVIAPSSKSICVYINVHKTFDLIDSD